MRGLACKTDPTNWSPSATTTASVPTTKPSYGPPTAAPPVTQKPTTKPTTTVVTTTTTTPLQTESSVFSTESLTGAGHYIEVIPKGATGGTNRAATDLGLPTDAITVEAEIMPISWAVTGTKKWGGIVGFTQATVGTANGSGFFISTVGELGQFQFALAVGTGPFINVIQSNVVTTPLELDAWYHVVGSYDGTTIRFFVNGKMVGQTTATGAIRYEP